MNNSDVLRRLRYAFDFSDQQVIDLFSTGGLDVTRELISNLMKKEEDPSYEPCSNVQLSAFLNGLIIKKRGQREGQAGPPPLSTELCNNDTLRKLKIALSLQEADMLELMELSGMPLSRAELSALFRKKEHRSYRACQDQILRNFLKGLQIKQRGPMNESNVAEPAEPVSSAAWTEALPGFVLTPAIEQAFARDGITRPTEPQRLAFQAIVEGKHVVIDSGTGTGKTLAYLLPLLQRLDSSPEGRVVCLSPAAELAIQTLNVANRYKGESINVGSLVGGGNQRKQKDRIQKSTRLVAGTVGRVLEAISDRKLKGTTIFVLDEPEPILSTKDAPFLLEVLARPPFPQVVVAGATFGQNSEALIKQLMDKQAIHVKAGASPLVSLITHFRMKVRDAGDRDLQLVRFLEQENADRAIVYVNQPHLIRHVYRHLQDAEVPTVTLSQDRTKQQCQAALREFSAGEVQVLLTTDRAATGIDIKGVPWVVHYEPPRSAQAYVHRAGHTGRAGKTGQSLALVSDQERFIFKGFEKELGLSFEEFRV